MYRFSFPTLIHFGAGSRNELGGFLNNQQRLRPLIVTDKGIASLPLLSEIEKLLDSKGMKAKTFSGVWGNPVKTQVNEGVEAFRQHDADVIIGLGGGAALDVAKAIALMIHHPGDLFDYEDDKPGALPINQPIPYWIAIPTTSGTGSEVGRSAVISDDKTHIKKIIFSPRLLAQAVFADPELTLGLPPHVTAATGMDALTHCVEAYLAKGYHPICDGIALEGLRIAGENLAKAVSSPKDISARTGMMMSSMMGAIAFQKGLGVTHSCAHALGTSVDMHHGLANGVMIDFALAKNIEAVPERFRSMATTLGLKDSSPQGFLAWLRDLKERIGLPKNLGAAKVPQEKAKQIVELAFADSCHQNNPCSVSKSDFEQIFSKAWA